ncbi:MAG: immune inhibitor A [Ardenticatenaceae bacterium]|nr:immune inhibitor A [Ardenticatenaceae bacterium]MCB8990197.1 immune inhibitor A [Ardenticatenaceae bacterium]MCB9003012.1 immune inhibitor A [Ardenticatenaceae bacterium]
MTYKKLLLLFGLIWALAGCGSDKAAVPPLVLEAPPTAVSNALTTLATHPLIPHRDMVALTAQFTGTAVPEVAAETAVPYHVGDVVPFWYKDLAAGSNEQINARLVYRSDALNMWVQEGARVDDDDVVAAGQFIEAQILPTNHAFFGHEWSPGVDGDPRINVLHLKDLSGVGIAYFSSSDEYVTAVNPYSNQREMLYVSLQDATVGSEQYFATIAHELQHMSQWIIDRNEDAWANEGLSELAVHVNGYSTHREATYAAQPDIPLTNLQQDAAVVGQHYAAAFLFTAYFNDRFGEEAMQRLVQHSENGVDGYTAVLNDLSTGLTFDDLFADWLVANTLSGLGRGEGVYRYQTIALPAISTQPLKLNRVEEATVSQYGADFWQIKGDEPLTLVFTGTQQVQTIDAAPHSGSHFWLSYPADESDMRLTRPVDLTGLDAATLTFWTWYDIEEGWDYGYVAVSTDDGATWDLLETQHTTRDNPEGNSFGPGFTGSSGGWVQETAVLTPYAGQTILLRFQTITDDAVHLAGWAIDDIAIPELGYSDDAEQDNGWTAAGFVRMTGTLPQRFIVQLVLLGDGAVQVQRLPLDANQQGRWPIPLGAAFDEAVIIVAGATPFTSETAVYATKLEEIGD